MAQASRHRSITPTAFKGFTPIYVEEGQAQNELRETIASSTLLERKQQHLKKTAATSTMELEIATEGVLDPSRLERSKVELTAFDGEFSAKKDRLDAYKKFVVDYERFLSVSHGLKLYCNEVYENSTTIVYRFGIDTDPLVDPAQCQALVRIHGTTIPVKARSESSAGSKKAQDYPHLLHPLEAIQIKAALNHCIRHGDKTVLVDIFERLEDGSIAVEKDGKPGIHTIVLCVQRSTHQILVIDPSNSDFSKHLVYNGDVICGYDHPMQILVSPVQIKIYSVPLISQKPPVKAPTGPNPNEYRDCTDIAVKLAFGINKHIPDIDMNKISLVPFVQEITNNKDINASTLLEDGPSIRIRQSSVDAHREKVQKLLLSTEMQADSAKEYKQDRAQAAINDEIEAILYPPTLHTDYDTQLAAIKASHDVHADLIGQIMKDFTA